MYSRRTFLKISAVLSALVAGGFLFKNSGNQKVKHILSSASHERLGISLSLSESTSKLELILDEKTKSDKKVSFYLFFYLAAFL